MLVDRLKEMFEGLALYVDHEGFVYDNQGNKREKSVISYFFPENGEILEEEKAQFLRENGIVRVITKEHIIQMFPHEYRVFPLADVETHLALGFRERISRKRQGLDTFLRGFEDEQENT
ncbi:hypothetical protein [Persephonella sp.]